MPSHNDGAIAQLGERLNGIQEVVGSIPIGSNPPAATASQLKASEMTPHFLLKAAVNTSSTCRDLSAMVIQLLPRPAGVRYAPPRPRDLRVDE